MPPVLQPASLVQAAPGLATPDEIVMQLALQVVPFGGSHISPTSTMPLPQTAPPQSAGQLAAGSPGWQTVLPHVFGPPQSSAHEAIVSTGTSHTPFPQVVVQSPGHMVGS